MIADERFFAAMMQYDDAGFLLGYTFMLGMSIDLVLVFPV